MAITPQAGPRPRRPSPTLLLDQLDAEWAAHEAQATPLPEAWEEALLAYYQTAVRVALHWIQGDPAFPFPLEYRTERLARACAHIVKVTTQDVPAVIAERDRQVQALRDRTWPAYEEVCAPWAHQASTGTDTSIRAEFGRLPYTWAGLDVLWSESEPSGAQDAPPSYLPKFCSPESEAFHCNALVVLFLNRAAKYQLCDLDLTPF